MRIYVGNMPFSMNDDQVRALFEPYGQVDSVSVVTDRETGRPRGFAFVEMPDDAAAQKAIEGLHEHMADGRPLNINQAKPREEKRRRERW